MAETQHLPTASKELHTSTPALSRAVKQLEAEVGCKLFRRVGRRIELNEAGEIMLDAVRDGMRLIHEGLSRLQSADLVGDFSIASAGLITTAYLIPALGVLRRQNPGFSPRVSTADPQQVSAQLLRGAVDVAFLSTPLQDARIVQVSLGAESSAVYCGVGHPFYGRHDVTLAEIASHEFIAPPADDRGMIIDGWPAEIPRKIAMFVDQMRVGCEVCIGGELLAVLPKVVAAAHSPRGELWSLDLEDLPPTPLFAFHRPVLGPRALVTTIVDAVRHQIAARGTDAAEPPVRGGA